LRRRAFISLAILIPLLAHLSRAQSPYGTISGIVVDPTGAAIANAEILVVNDTTRVQYPGKTNTEGIYIVSNLPPGPYRIQISKPGFKTVIKPDVSLSVQESASLNFTLPIGAVSEVITILGGAPLVNTESAAVSTVIDSQFVENLPLNGRSFNTLLQLTPGVVIAPSTFNAPGQFSIAGQRTTSNSFSVDGVGAIYHEHWSSIFSLFGCNLGDFGRDQALFAPRKTQLASDAMDSSEAMVMPLGRREELRLDSTNLLSRLGEIWGEIPNRLIQHLDLRNGVYGFVGMSDRTMYPIIRPGSIVQIDQNQQRILPLEWQNEHERPIYFIELRGQYICSWCEMRAGYLSAVPHPNSKCEVRRFSYPREAEIVGRVTGVTMRLVEAE